MGGVRIDARTTRGGALLLAVLAFAACGSPPAASSPSSGAAACAAHQVEACEQALLQAPPDELASMLQSYDEALRPAAPASPTGTGWSALWAGLKDHPEQVAFVHPGVHGALGEGLGARALVLDEGYQPRSIRPQQLLLALGGHARRAHVVWVAGPQRQPTVQHLFPSDPMAPHALALAPVLVGATDRKHLTLELRACALVHGMLKAAARFDYRAAAHSADELRTVLATCPADSEPAWRARRALLLLRSAAIELDVAAGASEPTWPTVPTAARPASSSYADFLRLQLLDDQQHQLWTQIRGKLVAELKPEQVALLDEMYRPPKRCLRPLPPPMQQPGDLLFSSWLSQALDSEPAKSAAATARAGTLKLDQWLPRYETLVRLVDTTKTMWAHAPSVLAQRGELHGLSASNTTTYKRVTELTLQHIAALRELAEAEPLRFRPIAVLPLLYQRGLLTDRRLREALTDLAQRSVALKLERAADVDAVYDAGLAGLMTSMSLPPMLQGAQLLALRDALDAKLKGPVGQQRGWEVAGLYGASGVLGLLSGQPEKLREAAPQIAQALGQAQDLSYPGLGKLAAAVARYGALAGTADLDPNVANQAMYSPPRREARRALRRALEQLTDDGPGAAPARQLLDDVLVLSDGLIATVAAMVLSDEPDGDDASCRANHSAAEDPRWRDAFDRLRRARRALLRRPAFRRGDGAWLHRARLIAAVLSDVLDVAQRKDGVSFTLPQVEVERIVADAMADGQQPVIARAVQGGYLLVRAAIDAGTTDQAKLGPHAAQVLRALAELFLPEPGQGAAGSSLFDALAEASSGVDLAGDTGAIADLLVSYARKSFAKDNGSQGDLFLFVALAVALARGEILDDQALALAQKHRRPVTLPLLMHSHRERGRAAPVDPKPLFSAIRQVAKEHCDAPSAEDVIALRQAVHDFRSGRRSAALGALRTLLADGVAQGLTVPRLAYIYEETTADKVFKLEGSISLASDYLKNSGSFQVGLGLRTAGDPGGDLTVRFADPASAEALEDSARLYAHVAALSAVYHFVAGEPERASESARLAVPAWAMGVKLGRAVVPAGEKGSEWAADALAAIAVAAQQAAEADQVFLAGDLWTLARKALGTEATDEDVDALFEPLPNALSGVSEIDAVVPRAKRSLRLVAAGLPCTNRPAELDQLLRVDCAAYPFALGYRIADALSALPHLKTGAEIGRPRCTAWRSLDTFLSAAEQKRYDPDAFSAAIAGLRSHGRPDDAATLLARQRHPQHCSPALVDHARQLAQARALGPHLRADLLSIAANCLAGKVDAQLVDDLLLLDELTRTLPVPIRNLQVVLFAARLALQADQWEPLLRLSQQPRFVQRWLPYGPQLATAALLIHHAAQVRADKPIDSVASLPLYRLLCTTFPPAERGATCQAIGVLRGGSAAADKKRAAKTALETLIKQMVSQGPAEATSNP